MFQASLTSAQVLLPGSQASLNSLLFEGHSLLSLASIMFAHGGIDQVNASVALIKPLALQSIPPATFFGLKNVAKGDFALWAEVRRGGLGGVNGDVAETGLVYTAQWQDY